MPHTMRKLKPWQKVTLGIIAVIIPLTFGGLTIVTRSQAHNLVTHPIKKRKPIAKTPGDYGLPYENVTVTSADGLELCGWYVPSQNGAVVIAQHGYKSDRTELLQEAEILYRHHYGVLLSTVRAHDRSEGEQISFGYREMQDLEAWYRYLRTRNDVHPEKIGALGNSMGGSLVIQYAAQNKHINAVVAHSAFSSLDDTVSTSVQYYTGLPPFPFAPLIVFWAEQELGLHSSEINAKQWIRNISPRPIFLLQGGTDVVISASSGQSLYSAAGEPKKLWYEPELGHAEFDKELPQEFEQRIIAFFDQYLLNHSTLAGKM